MRSCQKHRPRVNDSMGLFYGMDLTTTKVGMIRQNYNVIHGVNLRAEAKQFTYKTMQKKLHINF